MQNESIISLDAQNIQDQFIIRNNSIKVALQEGYIPQLKRVCTAIEKIKDSDEESYQILQITENVKKELQQLGYENVKYMGRSHLNLNYIAKTQETRVLYSIACLILREVGQDQLNKLDSTLYALIKMEHPNLQKIFKFQKTKQFCFVIMEECMGSYEELVVQQKNQINQNTFLKYSSEFLQGLEYMVAKMSISPQCISSLKNIQISFNHIAKVPPLIAGLDQMPNGVCFTIEEYLKEQQNMIYNKDDGQKEQVNKIEEKIALCGQLAHLLIQMILPQNQQSLQNASKNYIQQNRQLLLHKLNHIQNKDQILNQLIQIEQYYDLTLNKKMINELLVFINAYKKGISCFLALPDVSISQEEKNILVMCYTSYDFAELSQKRFIPIIDQELMDFQINRYFDYFNKLSSDKKRMPSMNGDQMNQLSIMHIKEQQSYSKFNDVSTYIQQSAVKMQGCEQVQQMQYNLSLIEEFILDRFDNLESDEQLDQSELKDMLDRLCNLNNSEDKQQNQGDLQLNKQENRNNDANKNNGFDNSIFSDLMNRIKAQNQPITVNTFLQIYLEKEREIMENYYGNQMDQIEHSFMQKKKNVITVEVQKSINTDIESQGGGCGGIKHTTLFTNENEFHTFNHNNNIKDVMKLLHQPFNMLLNPPTKFENVNRQHLKKEILKVKPDADFEIIVSEDQIFKILNSLHERNNISQYEVQPFQDILSDMQKYNKRVTISTFLDQYLDACKNQREQAVDLVMQNFDMKSQDQSNIRQIKGFNYFYQQMESLPRLNLIDYDNQLQKLKAPFIRIFTNISPNMKINFNNIRKKKQPTKLINQNLFGQPEIKPNEFYKSRISTEEPMKYANALFIGIIMFALALIALIVYCVWI